MSSICIPWKAWHGDESLQLDCPPNWRIQTFNMNDAPELDAKAIEKAFANPIGSKRISALAEGKKSAIIAVDDISRPSPLGGILPEVTKQLRLGGIQEDKIEIIIGLGAHRPMNRGDLIKKLGREVVDGFDIYNHNPFENLVDTGLLLDKTPVLVNRFFFEIELRIAIGSVIPHPFAGFSGGAKIVLPGLAAIEVLERSHKFALMGLRGGLGVVESNKFRDQIESIVRRIGLDISVNVVTNSQRRITGVFVGDVVQAHREAVEFARKVYSTSAPKDADLAVLNAYPKDTEFTQADNAFNVYRSTRRSFVKENGVIIISSACTNGRGFHSLFDPGMRLYKPPVKRRFLRNRKLIFFSPNINCFDFRSLFWDGYPFFNDWQELVKYLTSFFPERCNVAVFPCAPLQLIED